MSRLVALIDDYRDRAGQPSDASISRAIGIARQTLHSWRKRGVREPPSPETMRRLADLLRVDYERVVLRAALLDAGWIEEEPPHEPPAQHEETA